MEILLALTLLAVFLLFSYCIYVGLIGPILRIFTKEVVVPVTRSVVVPVARVSADLAGRAAAAGTDVAVSVVAAVAAEHDRAHGGSLADRVRAQRQTATAVAEKVGRAVGGGAVIVSASLVARELVADVLEDAATPEGDVDAQLYPAEAGTTTFDSGVAPFAAPAEYSAGWSPTGDPGGLTGLPTSPSMVDSNAALSPGASAPAAVDTTRILEGTTSGGGDTLPWSDSDPIAARLDSDHDGIPNLHDAHLGPGAIAEPTVPWRTTDPLAGRLDTDSDGIPNALDNKVGMGAVAVPGVPWNTSDPLATRLDFDHDGVPDAADNRQGPGTGRK